MPADPSAVLQRYGFGLADWWVEPRRNLIVTDDSERRLDPRVMEVLVLLAARAGEVVTRDELTDAIWRDAIVTENTVSQALSRLRRALGDDSHNPRFIETISKSGYRLIAEVRLDVGDPDDPVADALAPQASDEVLRPADSPIPHWLYRYTYLVVPAVTLGLVGAWAWFGRPAAPPAAIAQIVPELTLVGSQFEPSLSPRGDHVAFCWRSDEQSKWSVWVREVGAENPVRLTDHATHERLTAWSPDGASVAYVRFSDEGQPAGIFRSAVLGGTEERLADCGPGVRSINWSPDGRALVISRRNARDEPLHLDLLEIDGGATRVLTTPPDGILGDQAPVFSPDGSFIAFERRHNRNRHDVMVVDMGSGDLSRLTNHAWGQLRGLDWRSDGTHVIFSSNRSGQYALWQVPVSGGEPLRLPIDDTWVTQPSVSRDGGRLIYRAFRDVVDIWSLALGDEGAAAGEPVKQVSSTRSEHHPAWAPAGGAIAFLSDRSGSTELWSGKPDGTELMRHTDFAGPIPGSPSWSPDGRTIVFDAAVDGHADLWIVQRDSRQPVRITDDTSDELNATFSRDGESIYFASDRSGRWHVWRMPAEGGEATRVTEEGVLLAQESPDGESLYYVKLDEPGIWRMPVAGGEATAVLPDLSLSDWGSWVVGEAGIYFLRRGPTTLRFLNFADGSVRQVFAPPKQVPFLGRSLSLSADGRSLLFAMIDHSDDEIMRVDLAGL